MAGPLPSHPRPGVAVEAGDRITITGLRISLDDWYEPEIPPQQSVVARVPEWADDFPVGYSFALTQKLAERTLSVEGNRVQVSNSGWAIDVGLAATAEQSLRGAFVIANRTLDLLATNQYELSGLYQPLFEYATWRRGNGNCVLSRFTWLHLRFRVAASLQVYRPDGVVRTSPNPSPWAWHPSHAFFRRSQLTENLHDAYRNLFLALESVLSGPLPPLDREGERRWLRRALDRAATEYDIDLSKFIVGEAKSPLDTFLDEQYHAIRCALFHSKIGQEPILPDDLAPQGDILAAMRRLGALYIEVSRRVTGARFAGGGAGRPVFRKFAEQICGDPIYVSPEGEFTPASLHRAQPVVFDHIVEGESYLALRSDWRVEDLPGQLLRFGSVTGSGDESEERWHASGRIETARADALEIVAVVDLANAGELRRSYV